MCTLIAVCERCTRHTVTCVRKRCKHPTTSGRRCSRTTVVPLHIFKEHKSKKAPANCRQCELYLKAIRETQISLDLAAFRHSHELNTASLSAFQGPESGAQEDTEIHSPWTESHEPADTLVMSCPPREEPPPVLHHPRPRVPHHLLLTNFGAGGAGYRVPAVQPVINTSLPLLPVYYQPSQPLPLSTGTCPDIWNYSVDPESVESVPSVFWSG
ncbi:hypothetical protein K439DRAFT_1631035 [Ramaria rubella]|nr:hypothetical protein K439DRAFT_1631035 [Ramaria rubella]